VRAECGELLLSVRAAIPTVVFSVLDADGKDVVGVKVFKGDELLSDNLDGRPFELDPGQYELRFVLRDGRELTSVVLVREGEKNRSIQVKIPPSAVPDKSKIEPSPVAPPPSPKPVSHHAPVAAWVATGGAVAGVAVFSVFGLLSAQKKSDLDACAPYCGSEKHQEYQDVKRNYLIADIGLAAGVVSAITAVTLFAIGDHHEEHAKSRAGSRVALSLDPRPRGAGMRLAFGF
jgi:hypothetical protein